MYKNKVKQHIIPKFYLSRFIDMDKGSANRKQCYKYDVQHNVGEYLYPKDDFFTKDDFYTLWNNDGEKDLSVEDQLGVIENQAAPIIDKIINGKEISFQERGNLSVFIASFRRRTEGVLENELYLHSLTILRVIRNPDVSEYGTVENTFKIPQLNYCN